MRDYTQLTQEERYQIEALLKMGHHQSEIAVVLKRDKSTISREVRRNRGLRGYRPKQAQHLALARREAKAKPRIAPELGNGLRVCCARSGVRSRSAAGCRSSRDCMSVTNGSTSMSMRTSAVAATSMPACAARKSAGNATGAMTAGARSGSGSRSTSGRRSSRNAPASETGRPTP